MSAPDLLTIAGAGMAAARIDLDAAARNVAAAQASTPAHPYPRLVARFAAPEPVFGDDAGIGAGIAADPGDGDDEAPRFTGLVPNGETADALTEMIAVLDAQRAFEANASIFDTGKRIAERTLQIEAP